MVFFILIVLLATSMVHGANDTVLVPHLDDLAVYSTRNAWALRTALPHTNHGGVRFKELPACQAVALYVMHLNARTTAVTQAQPIGFYSVPNERGSLTFGVSMFGSDHVKLARALVNSYKATTQGLKTGWQKSNDAMQVFEGWTCYEREPVTMHESVLLNACSDWLECFDAVGAGCDATHTYLWVNNGKIEKAKDTFGFKLDEEPSASKE